MSARLRLAPALLVALLGVGLALHMSPSGAGSTVNPAPTSPVSAVGGVAITVADMDRSVAFYSTVLFFDKVSDVQTSGASIDRLLGVTGARVRVVTMRLGAERIELVEYPGRNARPVPADAGKDRSFQHIAIVVNDIDQAYLWLRRHHVEQTSPEPQRLPDWNPNTGGIRAFSFEDPDGHALEILQFPAGKGEARWQRPSDRVFLGIDHTAIVVGDTEKSLKLYRDTLGLQIAGGNDSYGPEQERLNNVPGARLRITTLRATEGPAIELVEYLAPRDGRPYPQGTMGNDLVRWHTLLVTTDADAAAAKLGAASGIAAGPILVSTADTPLGFRRGIGMEDPDGHGIQLRARESERRRSTL